MAYDPTQTNFAYDISKKTVSKGEILDSDVINQSIELILSTTYGERVFNPTFGSDFPNQIFEGFTQAKGEKLIQDVTNAIERWENRIVLDKDNVKFTFQSGEGILEVFIPYFIIKQQIRSYFSKKILV